MLIETRRNYTEASLLSPSLPSLFTRRARLPRFERNATPLVARTIGEDREYIHITHRSFILRKKEKKKEGRSQSVIFWRVISFFFFSGRIGVTIGKLGDRDKQMEWSLTRWLTDRFIPVLYSRCWRFVYILTAMKGYFFIHGGFGDLIGCAGSKVPNIRYYSMVFIFLFSILITDRWISFLFKFDVYRIRGSKSWNKIHARCSCTNWNWHVK